MASDDDEFTTVQQRFQGSQKTILKKAEIEARNERRKNREQFTHTMMKSEERYVNLLGCIVENILKPLERHHIRCGINNTTGKDELEFVVNTIRAMYQFHTGFLEVMRPHESILQDFSRYKHFTQMYLDYTHKYMTQCDILTKWAKNMNFREFMFMRLQGKKSQEFIDDSRLCNFPWLLFRPLNRISEYYRFFNDIKKNVKNEKNKDNEYNIYKLLYTNLIPHFKPLNDNIKSKLKIYRDKTRLVEISWQVYCDNNKLKFNLVPINYNNSFGIFNNKKHINDPLVRKFVYYRFCLIKKRKNFMKKEVEKQISLYILSDMLFWTSKRFIVKEIYHYKNKDFIFEKNKINTNEIIMGLINKDNKNSKNFRERNGNLKMCKGLHNFVFADDKTREIVYYYIDKAFKKYHKELTKIIKKNDKLKVLKPNGNNKKQNNRLEVSQSFDSQTVDDSADDSFAVTRHDQQALPLHNDNHFKNGTNNAEPSYSTTVTHIQNIPNKPKIYDIPEEKGDEQDFFNNNANNNNE